MTATVDKSTLPGDREAARDAADLACFGYSQQLRRRLGPYSSFAAGFSFVSILTTVSEFFGFGFGGPAFFWTWPLVFAGQFLVALCFAELASHYPIAGCIYQWSRRLAGTVAGWFAGWMMLLGQIVSVSAAAIALQETLPSVWSGFQFVGSNTSITSTSGATNAVILGSILIVATTVINVIGVNVMALINDIGVTCELVGVAVLVTALFVLPFGSVLGRVSPRTGTPTLPPIIIGILAIAILLINVGQAQLFAAIGSVAVVIVYLAYLGVTLPLLVRRLRGWPGGREGQGRFSLGRYGLAVNLAAVAWGAFICVNTASPRAAVYDPNGGHWYLQYFAPLFVAGAIAVGGLSYLLARRSAAAPLPGVDLSMGLAD